MAALRRCGFCEIEGTEEYGEFSWRLAKLESVLANIQLLDKSFQCRRGQSKRLRRASRPRYSPAALCQSGHNHLPLVFRIVIAYVRSAAHGAEERPLSVPGDAGNPDVLLKAAVEIVKRSRPLSAQLLARAEPGRVPQRQPQAQRHDRSPRKDSQGPHRNGSLRSIQQQPTRIQNYLQHKDVCYAA
jgi:hypothetical protein